MAGHETLRASALETRLDSRDWRLCATAEAFMSWPPGST